MLDKERLLKVAELDRAKIRQMDDSNLNFFTITANSFIDAYPTQEENVKSALKTRDIGALTNSLSVVCDTLRQIYAEELAGACADCLNNVNNVQYEDLQAFVVDFLKTVSALSIDLQMVEYKDTPGEGLEPTGKNAILAVDDVHFFLNTISSMLQDSGYQVTCINSGMAALNYLKTHRPDLFLLDIEMPRMDGYELARKIRESGQTAPIIFLTGHAKKDFVVKALHAGGADFIVKPVTKAELLGRIGKYIKPGMVIK